MSVEDTMLCSDAEAVRFDCDASQPARSQGACSSTPGGQHHGRTGLADIGGTGLSHGLITYIAIATWSITAAGYTEGLQVVGFAVFSTPLTILPFVAGLPLRVSPRARRWWFRHAWWFFTLFGLAVGGMLLSYVLGDAGPVHNAEADLPLTDGYVPDARLFVPSLVVLAFATMHLRLPARGRPRLA
jgi:hypothetical protein